MRTDRLRLLDALEQLELSSTFARHGREAFFNDLLYRARSCTAWLCWGSVPCHLAANDAEIPWGQFIGFRNVVIHEYFGVDLELVWTIVAEHVVTLQSQLSVILEARETPPPTP